MCMHMRTHVYVYLYDDNTEFTYTHVQKLTWLLVSLDRSSQIQPSGAKARAESAAHALYR